MKNIWSDRLAGKDENLRVIQSNKEAIREQLNISIDHEESFQGKTNLQELKNYTSIQESSVNYMKQALSPDMKERKKIYQINSLFRFY